MHYSSFIPILEKRVLYITKYDLQKYFLFYAHIGKHNFHIIKYDIKNPILFIFMLINFKKNTTLYN